ncbi:MAG: ribonuclease Y [Candidatus Tagabacteria bacterium CG_4_9_14_0_2_um_filter_41_11]|uniref:Ribonuclease Y n=1 Tax=Candidatus Tagabacteria bacterium CG_4_9_14_0_2_um_filter_41_11 TaxID=1975019 RepID=A0A2M8ER10_9BACT|nr:MAG: ribonuclease Y [Candidatus Tagabacteria bacterium CG11_big_fil_rev_8_21_14_0_20_41_11]PJC25178.1 MAG: ribonuclease Y [Candidatus Tagabacteria bacterium CG_4_9_14_0_2_um_filter_41_11]
MLFFSTIVKAVVVGLFGIGVGYFLRHLITLGKKESAELKIKQLLLDAKTKTQTAIEEANKKAALILEDAKREEKTALSQVRKLEERLLTKEELLDKRRLDIEKENRDIQEKIAKVKQIRQEVENLEAQKRAELVKIAGLSEEEAKNELFKDIEKKYENDILLRLQKLENTAHEEYEKKARNILIGAMQRLSSSTASEVTTTTVPIPSDDLKGKIIGKEGRNIRALERAAGIEIIVDDTPGSVVISGFDPVRRQIAKIALEHLILDGRIQPARIEETVEKAKIEVEKLIKEKGKTASYEVGIFDLDPRLLTMLGRLYFRVSFGQNVLQHSIEVTHLSGMLASELGADVQVAKKGALVHDIGKAMDHEVQGTHTEIGKHILKKFNVDEKVIKAMQSHHEDCPYESLEAIIVQAADALSASRPGARRDTLENYLKRLEDLERIANSFTGVEKSYAIQAGREIRIFVTPEKVSDLEAKKLAREIADRIEDDLKYPGEIKVHIIRENRIVEYAR